MNLTDLFKQRAVTGWCAAGLCALVMAAPFASGEIVLSVEDPAEADDKKPGLKVPAPDGQPAPNRHDVIEFLSGDKLRGTFYSINTNAGVRWRHPSIRQVLQVDPSSVATIKLNRPEATNRAPEQTCLVRLQNDDELLGELVSVDETHIHLKTWYAGPVAIPRVVTRYIVPGQASTSSLYEGPDNLEGWTVTKNTRYRRSNATGPKGWRYRNGAFYCSGGGSIGRDIKLTDLSSIEFDMAWSGYLQLSFAFYTDNLENYSGDCYMIQFSSGSIYLQRMNKNGNSNNLGHSEASALSQGSKARVMLRSNKEDKNISLYLNGDMVKQWTDRGDFAKGTGIAFFHQGQGVIRVSNLLAREWDGKMEQGKSDDKPGKEDMVRLGNNDQISGSLKTIKEGKMSFGTEFATLEVPLDRIAQISMAREAEGEERGTEFRTSDVRAVFSHRGTITFKIDSWDDQQITGTSASVGKIKLLPSAFSRIDFNLDQQRADPDLLDLSTFERDFEMFFDN